MSFMLFGLFAVSVLAALHTVHSKSSIISIICLTKIVIRLATKLLSFLCQNNMIVEMENRGNYSNIVFLRANLKIQ